MWKVYILHHSYWDWRLASAWRCHMWQSWKFSQREIKSLFLVLVVNKFCTISNFTKLRTLTLAACSYVLLVLYACHPKHFYLVLQCEGTRWEWGSRVVSWYLSRLNSLAGSLYGTTCLVPTAMLLPDSILLASRFEFAEYFYCLGNTSAIIATPVVTKGSVICMAGHLPQRADLSCYNCSLIPRLQTQWGLGMRL